MLRIKEKTISSWADMIKEGCRHSHFTATPFCTAANLSSISIVEHRDRQNDRENYHVMFRAIAITSHMTPHVSLPNTGSKAWINACIAFWKAGEPLPDEELTKEGKRTDTD